MVVRLQKFICMVLALSLITAGMGVAEANAESSVRNPPEVNQGWQFSTLRGNCTIGYNDPENRISYTAGHCAHGVSRVYLTKEDGKGNQRWIHAGTISLAPSYDERTTSNDWAIIRWKDGVTINPNTFDRDGIEPIEKLHRGQRICFHGHTSHGALGKSDCGRVIGTIGNKVLMETSKSALNGDSGGPVYLPRRGLVGVLSTSFEITDRFGRKRYVVTGNVPAEGPIVSTGEESALINRYFGSHVNIQEQDLDPGSSFMNVLGVLGFADPEGAAIGLVLGGVALGGLIIGAILHAFMQ